MVLGWIAESKERSCIAWTRDFTTAPSRVTLPNIGSIWKCLFCVFRIDSQIRLCIILFHDAESVVGRICHSLCTHALKPEQHRYYRSSRARSFNLCAGACTLLEVQEVQFEGSVFFPNRQHECLQHPSTRRCLFGRGCDLPCPLVLDSNCAWFYDGSSLPRQLVLRAWSEPAGSRPKRSNRLLYVEHKSHFAKPIL